MLLLCILNLTEALKNPLNMRIGIQLVLMASVLYGSMSRTAKYGRQKPETTAVEIMTIFLRQVRVLYTACRILCYVK